VLGIDPLRVVILKKLPQSLMFEAFDHCASATSVKRCFTDVKYHFTSPGTHPENPKQFGLAIFLR
jgi:hypothetical protein